MSPHLSATPSSSRFDSSSACLGWIGCCSQLLPLCPWPRGLCCRRSDLLISPLLLHTLLEHRLDTPSVCLSWSFCCTPLPPLRAHQVLRRCHRTPLESGVCLLFIFHIRVCVFYAHVYNIWLTRCLPPTPTPLPFSVPVWSLSSSSSLSHPFCTTDPSSRHTAGRLIVLDLVHTHVYSISVTH